MPRHLIWFLFVLSSCGESDAADYKCPLPKAADNHVSLCHDGPTEAPDVELRKVCNDAPQLNGGAIQNGIYTLVAATEYGSECDATTGFSLKIRLALVISDGHYRWSAGDGDSRQRTSGAVTICGNNIMLDESCGGTEPILGTFDASNYALVLALEKNPSTHLILVRDSP